MKYYCDGSQHKELGKMYVGIVGQGITGSYEILNFWWEEQLHEVEAIIKVIELVDGKGKLITIVNDDRYLINNLNKIIRGKKVKSKLLIKYPRFVYMLSLIEKFNVRFETPDTVEEKEIIKECHNLSRKYLN